MLAGVVLFLLMVFGEGSIVHVIRLVTTAKPLQG